MASQEKQIIVTITISETVHGLLAVLDERGDVDEVIQRLVDHAQQGVYRPGSWERGWLEQVFGADWQARLEPGDPYGRPDTPVWPGARSRSMFQRPARPPAKGEAASTGP